MKKKTKKRILTFATAILAGLLMSHGLVELANDAFVATSAFADSANSVSLGQTTAQTNDNGLVYVDINVTGTPNANVVVTYRTQSGTAIENIDYQAVYSTIDIKLDISGKGTHKVAIKSLNDSSNREKLRVYSGEKDYGRYFNLTLVSVSNGAIDETRKTCKCYLDYDYRAEATVGLRDAGAGREVAYLNDYRDMISKYHKGDNDISGKEHWRTWKEGISFNNDTTKRWVNTFINPGFADAYGTYILETIDDDKFHSTTNIHMRSGNKEFIDKYSNDCPGMHLYYEIEPCKKGGDTLDGKAMYYIANNKNPHGKDGDLVDMVEMNKRSSERLRRYWIQKEKAWFSGANSIYDTVFFKTPPYNGVLDYGLSIFNGNKSWDREVHNIWMFLALVDTKEPVLLKRYVEFDTIRNALRIYLRFNEPVYASKGKASYLRFNVNNGSNKYDAEYADGNYSDTLVYEYRNASTLQKNIEDIKFEVLNSDIGDMAYNLDAYKIVRNNFYSDTAGTKTADLAGGGIDLSRPEIAFIKDYPASTPRAVHNVTISANGNGDTSFSQGTVYYSWRSVSEGHIPDEQKQDPSAYAFSHVLTSEELGAFDVTLSKAAFESGEYYLDVLAVSPFGITATGDDGPYKLDGEVPAVDLQINPNNLLNKEYKVRLANTALGASLTEVTTHITCQDLEGNTVSNSYKMLTNGAVVSDYKDFVKIDTTSEAGYTIFDYKSDITPTTDPDELKKRDTLIQNLMGERSRLPIEISFEVVNSAGNRIKTEPTSVVYDLRTLFEHTVTPPTSYVPVTDITGVSAPVFDIASAQEGDGISFTLTDSTDIADATGGAAYKIVLNGETEFEADSSHIKVTLKDLEPGYYEAVGVIHGTVASTEVDKVSSTYSFYLTNGKNDETTNKKKAEGGLVLTNKVYRLEDARYYYFRSSDTTVQTLAYGATYDSSISKWQGGSTTPTFSTTVEAKKYVKFMEYQDLDLIAINQTIANSLNNPAGQTSYVKAPKETRSAAAGQLWIRYKKATWTTDTGANGWAFYYYGEGNVENGLDVTNLSANLSGAIDEVSNRIIGAGSDLYLVGEENVNPRTGAPTLPAEDIHVGAESASQTMNGVSFLSELTYRGDSAIYQNNVKINSTDYPIATNLALEVTNSTALFYHFEGVETWTRLEATDGQLLKSALANSPSGLYTIREYGPEGVGEFTVYLDQSLPQLRVLLNSGLADQNEMTLDGTITRITCKSVILEGLLGEKDPYAYVAIYSYPSRSLQTVLYGSAIENYLLEDGNFYLEVGDRSGNVVTYTIWTSSTAMDWSLTSNEAGTAVIFTMNNRTSAEIYSYEVYLNEVLIDTVFDTQKIYRQAGHYRVVVADIYNADSPESKTLTHEAPAPDMKWSYLNDSGSYSTYDPNNPIRMVLTDDEAGTRTTNVRSSTLIRVQFTEVADKDIEFEITGLAEGEYTYNTLTGLLTINSLSSWTLRVWYKNQPENDHLFVFSVDADAPEVSASFIGVTYRPYVLTEDDPLDEEKTIILETSSFDFINFDSYKVGDAIVLDTLQYETNAQSAVSFVSGAIISGNHIVLHLTDASGIRAKDLSVTRNGVKVDAVLSGENELVLNGYGTYVVVVVDNLGNTTRFVFVNLEGATSNALIDGEVLDEDVLTEDDPLDEEKTIILETSSFDFINFDSYKVGDAIVLDTLQYETNAQSAVSFVSGAIISGNHIVLHLTDASGIRAKDLSVTRNGVKVDAVLSGDNELVLNGYGTYVVVVVDNLGNTTRFVFVNLEGATSNALIDGEVLDEDVLTYGHDAMEVETLYDGVTTFLIKAGEGTYAYEFHYENGVLTYGNYLVKEETEGEGESATTVKYSEYNEASFRLEKDLMNNFGVWYVALQNDRFTIHATIDDAGNARYRVSSLGAEVYVEARYESGTTHLPERYMAALSTTAPELVLMTDDIVAEKLESLDYIFINGLLTIDETKVASSITDISYKFSTGPNYDDKKITTIVLMENGEWKEHLKGEELGYYWISVTNKYGNTSSYVVRKIESFASEVVVHTLDGASVTFGDNENTIYSNYSIELIVFSTDVEFEINGVSASGISGPNQTTYTLDRDGTYTVVVKGTNGIQETFQFEIASDDDFIAKDEWITGWNEEALLHAEGYTNTLCSIELGEGVVFIDMRLEDGERVILYDAITGTGKTDVNALKNVIGSLGIGKYTISFRNKYGDLVTKTVHYNNVPSIILSRAIASDPNSEQIYDLALAVRKGFYSNYVLYFSTTSSNYFFTINGEEYRLDEKKSLEFSNISGNGSIEYAITYLDEYGNYVEFKAFLSRVDVEFDATAMETITIGETLYTRDDIVITFGEDLKATLSVDGGDALDYESGTMRYADGTYTFVVRDIAGNNVTFTIVHKSMNHYSLTVANTGEDVIDGGVVNDSNVIFRSEDNSSFIKYVVRNGDLITELTSSTFTLTGHYELLIEDAVGNQSFEEFTILNNDLATFTYTAPFDYEVTEVWRVAPDGSRELTNIKGKTITLNQDGDYLVIVTSTKTASFFNFTVGIDNTDPTAKLVGVEDGGVTARDVTLSGLRTGDVVRIYKNGELILETTVSVSNSVPAITTGGKYRIVVTNVQGRTLEFNFTRKAITNVPGSIFIIVFSALLIAAVGIGLTYRTKLKTDD